MLEKVLDRDNFNRAFRPVKANKGACGVDGMTTDEALSPLSCRVWSIFYTSSLSRVFHAPFVKSGISTLTLPLEMDSSDSGVIAIHEAAS